MYLLNLQNRKGCNPNGNREVLLKADFWCIFFLILYCSARTKKLHYIEVKKNTIFSLEFNYEFQTGIVAIKMVINKHHSVFIWKIMKIFTYVSSVV